MGAGWYMELGLLHIYAASAAFGITIQSYQYIHPSQAVGLGDQI